MQQTPTDNLVVRQHERVRCALPASCMVADDLETVVSLAAGVGDAQGAFTATLTDVSRGGVGLRSKVFMPKNVRLTVKINAGGAVHVLKVKVMRVVMADRTPQYDLGTAFIDSSPADKAAVDALTKAAQQEAARA